MSPEDQAIERAKQLREQIINDCHRDPFSCSCDIIPCEDVLDSEHEQKEQAYQRCLQEKQTCYDRLDEGRQKALEQRERISSTCRENLDECDCSQIDTNEGRRECEIELERARREAEAQRTKFTEIISEQCRISFDNCDCSIIENPQGRDECELAVLTAKREAQREREKKIVHCTNNIDDCDCSSIENQEGREECFFRLNEAKELKEKIESACREDLGACDCTSIENEKGRRECEQRRREAMEEAGAQVNAALIRCFRNVDECVCSELGLPKQEYVDFCEVQQSYGFNCRDHGLYCEKLEEISYVPFGLPQFLEPIFRRTYADLVNREKEAGAREGAELMRNCITDPENCDCSLAPSYAVDFCEHKKQLQLKCYADNYEACMILEDEPNLPEMMPSYARGMFEQIADGVRRAQAGMVKANAARRVGNMILECMLDSAKCDCSFTPQGRWKAFCEQKARLVVQCNDEQDYNSCFRLDEEPIYTDDMPGFIINHIERSVVPRIEENKIILFNRMKIGTICEDVNSISECRDIFYG